MRREARTRTCSKCSLCEKIRCVRLMKTKPLDSFVPSPSGGNPDNHSNNMGHGISRREALKSTIAAVGLSALAFEPARAAEAAQPDARRASPKRYDMKKSINLWAFPYPQRMTLEECLRLAKDAGFDGIELNYDLDSDLSPKSGTKDYENIRKLADRIGIQIS